MENSNKSAKWLKDTDVVSQFYANTKDDPQFGFYVDIVPPPEPGWLWLSAPLTIYKSKPFPYAKEAYMGDGSVILRVIKVKGEGPFPSVLRVPAPTPYYDADTKDANERGREYFSPHAHFYSTKDGHSIQTLPLLVPECTLATFNKIKGDEYKKWWDIVEINKTYTNIDSLMDSLMDSQIDVQKKRLLLHSSSKSLNELKQIAQDIMRNPKYINNILVSVCNTATTPIKGGFQINDGGQFPYQILNNISNKELKRLKKTILSRKPSATNKANFNEIVLAKQVRILPDNLEYLMQWYKNMVDRT